MARQDPLHLAATLPCWGGPVSPVPLAGGLTNDNFLVQDGGERYVVRVGGDILAHNIVRTTEAAASRSAHAAGVSPRVHYADANALVIGFVDGRTLTPEDVRAPENHARLVDLIKRAHREIPKHFPGPAPLFWVFQVVRHYDRVLRELHSPHVSSLPAFGRMAERLEQAVGQIDIVFGHNDMLPANLLDDGERLWLVDWEYAGFNSPLFDLGGLASARDALEHGLRADERNRLRLPRLHIRESQAFQRRLRRLRGHSDVSATKLPASARIVIVGGGIVGSSVAYHLGAMGLTDVLLIERGKLTSGSTWHAAGLVGQLRSSANITQLLGYSVDLYDRLEAETGQATGWKRNGGLRLACNAERWTEVKRQATTARSFGLEMQLLSAKEAQNLWPLMQVDDVVGAAFLPTDGQASPSDIAAALAKGARMKGVTIREGVAITGVEVDNGAVSAVVTAAGRVACEKLVICAGLWSRAVGRLAGVNVPLTSIQHQYIVT